MNRRMELKLSNRRLSPDPATSRSRSAAARSLRAAAAAGGILSVIVAIGASLTRAQSALEKITPDWGEPDAWALLGSGPDASAEHVALVRGTDPVTMPTTGWATRDLFVWTTGGRIEAAYGPATGTGGDPISRLGVRMSADGSRAVFGTWRQAYPQGHDLRLWDEDAGQSVIFSSGLNFDLEHAAISGDGRTAAVVEVRPLTLDNRVFREYIYVWREGGTAEAVAGWEGNYYIRGLALSADGSRLAYTIQHPPELPELPGRGELRLIDETGDRVLFSFFGGAAWGELSMSADGRSIAVLLPADPIEMGGLLGKSGPKVGHLASGSDPSPGGVYLWRDGDAPRRLGPPIGTWSTGGPTQSASAERVVWPGSPGPGQEGTILSWTADGGIGYVDGPNGAGLTSGSMTADGAHWTLWMDDGPDGPGLYRYEEVAGPEPSPTPTATESPTERVFLPAAFVGRQQAARNSHPPERAPAGGTLHLVSGAPESAPAGGTFQVVSGTSEDTIADLATRADGGACGVGRSHSDGLVQQGGVAQPARAGGFDAVVFCRDASGALEALTYLGGSGYDGAAAVAIGADGAVYVVGDTSSEDFPVSRMSYQASLLGVTDAFVAKLSADLSRVEWATLLGGGNPGYSQSGGPPAIDSGSGIAVASTGEVVVTGGAWHSLFPTTAGSAHPAPLPQSHDVDAYVARLSADGSSLVSSTYVVFTDRFGTQAGEAFDVALDAQGRPVVVGDASAAAYVVRLSSNLDAVEWSTRIGCCVETDPGIFMNPELRHASSVAIVHDGGIVVTGLAAGSSHPPTTEGAFQPDNAGGFDAFVAKLADDGSLGYLSYLGGSGHDEGSAIAIDDGGSAWIGGTTYSYDFPMIQGNGFGAVDCPLCGNGFTTLVSYLGDELTWSDRWGGELDDAISGVDCRGGFAGYTYSSAFHSLLLQGGLYADGVVFFAPGSGCMPASALAAR